MKNIIEKAKELLKAIAADPKALEELTKSKDVKTGLLSNPNVPASAHAKLMTKEEIKADLKAGFKPKFAKKDMDASKRAAPKMGKGEMCKTCKSEMCKCGA